MQRGALVQDVVALHIVMGKPHPSADERVSVSTQMATMRRLLYGWETQDKETGHWFRQAAEVCLGTWLTSFLPSFLFVLNTRQSKSQS